MTSAIERAARAVGDWVNCTPHVNRISYAGYASTAITAFLSEDEEMEERVANALWVAYGDSAPNEPRAFIRGSQEPHDGGCTGQPYGCGACTCIEALAVARAAIAALREMATSATEPDL